MYEHQNLVYFDKKILKHKNALKMQLASCFGVGFFYVSDCTTYAINTVY